MSIEEKVFTKGIVNGKAINEIMLDTGAETSAVASDLVSHNAVPIRHLIVEGVMGSQMTCPVLRVPSVVKGKRVTIPALAVPRNILKHDMLLGRDTPRLHLNDWDIDGDEDWDLEPQMYSTVTQSGGQPTTGTDPPEHSSTPVIQLNEVKRNPLPAKVKLNPLPVQVVNQSETVKLNPVKPDPVPDSVKVPTRVNPQVEKPFPASAKPVSGDDTLTFPDTIQAEDTYEPKPLQKVDIGVLTRAQVNREREELEALEKLDLQAEATPTPLGSYNYSLQDEAEGEVDAEVERDETDPELAQALQAELYLGTLTRTDLRR